MLLNTLLLLFIVNAGVQLQFKYENHDSHIEYTGRKDIDKWLVHFGRHISNQYKVIPCRVQTLKVMLTF